MSNKGKLFRTSVSGFNKDDVNSYIISQAKDFSDKEAELNEIIEALRVETASLKEELSGCSSAKDELEKTKELLHEKSTLLDEASAKLQSAEERCSTLTLELEKMTEENAEIKRSASDQAEKDRQITELQKKTEELTLINSKYESERNSYASYDRVGGQVEDILSFANKTADEVIKKAESDSSSTKARVREALSAVVEELKRDIDSGTEFCMKDLKSYAHDITESSRTLIADLEKRYSVLTEKILRCREMLDDSLVEKNGDPTVNDAESYSE